MTMVQRIGGGVYEAPVPMADYEPFRPTYLMEQVSRYVENFPGRPKRAILDAGLGKRKETVAEALQHLVDERFVDEKKVSRGFAYETIRPYREAEDDHSREQPGTDE
jgi:hypothetical protein